MEDLEQKSKSEETDDLVYHDFNIDNIIYRTTIPKRNQDKKPYTPKDPKEIYVFIPGTIISIHVKKKEKVKKGDKLVTFSAMKMNNVILAPVNGVIENVFVKEGDNVNKSQMVLKIK